MFMAEITFISNKTKKEVNKYLFVITTAVIIWLLQVSVISSFFVFDSTINFFLLGSIYSGAFLGMLPGTIFGVICSFFTASTLHDHIFYFSYPLIGLFCGLFTKNFFSDELLFYASFSFVLTFMAELLNGLQYSMNNQVNIIQHYLHVSLSGALLNLLFAPVFYFLMRLITKKLKLW